MTAIAPDTTGMNFYRADPSLRDLLRLYLTAALFAHIDPHLDRLGALAGGRLRVRTAKPSSRPRIMVSNGIDR